MNTRKATFRAAISFVAAALFVVIGTAIPATAAGSGGGVHQATINGILLTEEPTLIDSGVLVPDCEGLSEEAADYAIANEIDICGLLDEPGDVASRDYRTGLCGSSGIQAYQAPGANVHIEYGFSSTVGNMGIRALEVEWAGSAAADYMLDFNIMNAAVYSSSTDEYTGTGLAETGLFGTATTVWGLTCYLQGPVSSIVVTY